MAERKRASKSVHLSFDPELEAMALIKKAMNLVYPAEQGTILKWAVSRFLSTSCDVNEAIVIRKTKVKLVD